jgi:hypothetical protein
MYTHEHTPHPAAHQAHQPLSQQTHVVSRHGTDVWMPDDFEIKIKYTMDLRETITAAEVSVAIMPAPHKWRWP